ncbi:hypothetical protein J6590_060547 [Homalodisca vitripennis]|nr:hypothetical protein J6590_060547 [Homalodisca vitripennis]
MRHKLRDDLVVTQSERRAEKRHVIHADTDNARTGSGPKCDVLSLVVTNDTETCRKLQSRAAPDTR